MIVQTVRDLADRSRDRVVDSTTGLFAHAPYPLASTLDYAGDPGLFGADSVTWPVIGDAAAFVGGIRALLIQAAHPEVSAGVADHSRYRQDPLGRLSRTSAYVTATSFGAIPEVHQAVAMVRRAHRPVQGISDRGRSYAADAPGMAAWVHNALTDSFLVAYQHYGPTPISAGDADRFVLEQTRVGRLLDAAPLPPSAAGLSSWLSEHPDLEASRPMEAAIQFLRSPPLPPHVRSPYRALFAAAVATLPPWLRELLGVRTLPGALALGRTSIGALRWALGSSPSWHLALVRVGAAVPPGVFRQRLRAGNSSQGGGRSRSG